MEAEAESEISGAASITRRVKVRTWVVEAVVAWTVYVVREEFCVGIPNRVPFAPPRARPDGSAGLTLHEAVAEKFTVGISKTLDVPRFNSNAETS